MAEGHDAWKAVVDAAVHRTPPVLLTVTAVLAMIPLTQPI
jgi:multidrug efflux pump